MSDEILLYLEDISVSFDGYKALDALTLYINRGELRCIIGPNGAGKTTLMDVITGRIKPDVGRAYYGKETDLTRFDESAIASMGIGRKFQRPTVFENHTVAQNIELALAGSRGLLYNLCANLDAAQLDRIDELLLLTGLEASRNRDAGTLSHGQKQWLEIGMLVAQDPELLLMDEPVAGMTTREIEATGELLARLAVDHSVVVIEHDMDFVRSIAEAVTVLHEGQVLLEGSYDAVSQHERVRQVYLGV